MLGGRLRDSGRTRRALSLGVVALLVLAGNRGASNGRAASGGERGLGSRGTRRSPALASAARNAVEGGASSEEERARRRLEGARAQLEFAHRSTESAPARALAALRAALACAASKKWEEARAALQLGLGLCQPRAPLRWRIELELAHLCRRSSLDEEALAAYERLGEEVLAPPEIRACACWWAARELEDGGDSRAALRRYRRLAEGAQDPFTRLRSYDRWARIYVQTDDLEAAAGVLHACALALREAMTADGEPARKLRTAFETMLSRTRLARAIELRRARR